MDCMPHIENLENSSYNKIKYRKHRTWTANRRRELKTTSDGRLSYHDDDTQNNRRYKARHSKTHVMALTPVKRRKAITAIAMAVLGTTGVFFVNTGIAMSEDINPKDFKPKVSQQTFVVRMDANKTTVPAPRKTTPPAAAQNTDGNAGNNAAAPVDWTAPTGVQPDLANYSNLHIDVSIAEQKTRIYSGNDVIYEMVSSTGVDNSTPTGDFTINHRGESFFNPKENMGAKTWVGFIGTTYLFHSVPTDANGDWIESEALKLGHPASHGCVRLTVADSQWFYSQVPDGTPVHIA